MIVRVRYQLRFAVDPSASTGARHRDRHAGRCGGRAGGVGAPPGARQRGRRSRAAGRALQQARSTPRARRHHRGARPAGPVPHGRRAMRRLRVRASSSPHRRPAWHMTLERPPVPGCRASRSATPSTRSSEGAAVGIHAEQRQSGTARGRRSAAVQLDQGQIWRSSNPVSSCNATRSRPGPTMRARELAAVLALPRDRENRLAAEWASPCTWLHARGRCRDRR